MPAQVCQRLKAVTVDGRGTGMAPSERGAEADRWGPIWLCVVLALR